MLLMADENKRCVITTLSPFGKLKRPKPKTVIQPLVFSFDAITRSFWHVALWPCNVSCINITFKPYTFQKFPQILKMTDVTEIKQPLAFIRPNDHMRCFWLGFLIPRVINIKGTVDARWSTNQVTRHDCCRPPYDLHVGAIPLHHPLAARCHIW